MKSEFQKIYDESIENPELFWGQTAENIFWYKKPSKILNKSNYTRKPITTHQYARIVKDWMSKIGIDDVEVDDTDAEEQLH